MLTGDTTTGNPAAWWGKGDYELRERAYAPIHQRVIERLAPQPGERVLDVACGLGAIAARAARAGAEVTAIDLAPSMIERASRRPEPVDWQIGDCQSLPFDDGSFDVVVSSFGVIFAPDPCRAAAELSRVSEEGVWWLQGRSGEAIWSWVVRTSPPVRARLQRLSRTEARAARSAWIRRYESFRINGTIHIPQMYLLSIGHKQRQPRVRRSSW